MYEWLGGSIDLPRLESITGRPITAEKTASGHASFSMELPPTGFNLSSRPFPSHNYYHGSTHRSKADLMVMAQLVRATGAETIIVDIDHPDEVMAMKLAREGFECAREVGYDPKQITVKIRGKTFSVEDLFKDAHQRQAATEMRAEASKSARGDPAKEQKLLKDEMEAARATTAAAKAAAAPATVAPPPAATSPEPTTTIGGGKP